MVNTVVLCLVETHTVCQHLKAMKKLWIKFLTLYLCTVYLPARTYEHGYPQMPHCDTVTDIHERIAKPNQVPLQTGHLT